MFLLPLSNTCMPRGVQGRIMSEIHGLLRKDRVETFHFALPAERRCLIGMWCTSCCCAQTQHWSLLDSCHFWTVPPLPVNNISKGFKYVKISILIAIWCIQRQCGCVCTGQPYLNRSGFRYLPQNDNAPLVIRTHFLPFLIHLYHRRGWGGKTGKCI